VLLCDWLPPEFGAVGQYTLASARQLAAHGGEVTLVGLTSKESGERSDVLIEGTLTIKKVHRPSYDRSAWLRRATWTVVTNIALVKAAWEKLQTCDEIRFTGSPPYLVHFVMPIAWLLGKRTRYRITDFHPECLIAALGREPVWLKPLKAFTNFWRRRVSVVEVLGEDQRRRIVECAVQSERIVLVRDGSPVECGAHVVAVNPPAVLRGRAIVLYSGNWGIAHDVHTFVEGFSLFCADYPGAAGVWLNATGKRADIVQQLLADRQLPVSRTNPVPLEELPGVLAAADVHLITLTDAFVGYVLPSKVYACVESGRSVLFVGSADSDVHLVCSTRMAPARYRRVDVGNPEGVRQALVELLAGKMHV
jgi:glycosyltransferase involved in cell wall biosynthesis